MQTKNSSPQINSDDSKKRISRAYRAALSVIPQAREEAVDVVPLELYESPARAADTRIYSNITVFDLSGLLPSGFSRSTRFPIASPIISAGVVSKIAIGAHHPDLFTFISATNFLANSGATAYIMVNTDFPSLIEEEGFLPVKYLNENRWVNLTVEEQLARLKNAINADHSGPDLIPCQDGTIFSIAAGKSVGIIENGKIYYQARKILEVLSTSCRELGCPYLLWTNRPVLQH